MEGEVRNAYVATLVVMMTMLGVEAIETTPVPSLINKTSVASMAFISCLLIGLSPHSSHS